MSEGRGIASGVVPLRRPGALIGGPEDVLRDPGMTAAEKRAVLARWASDAHAVENAPALRQLDDGSVVTIDDILSALRALDGENASAPARHPGWRPPFGRQRGRLLSRLRIARRPEEDDDDPPPRPAAAARAVRIELADALAA